MRVILIFLINLFYFNDFSAAGCAVTVEPCGGSPSTCRLMGKAREIAIDVLYPPIIKRDRFVNLLKISNRGNSILN